MIYRMIMSLEDPDTWQYTITYVWINSADKRVGKLIWITTPVGGLGPNCIANVFVFVDSIIFSPLYKWTLSLKANDTLHPGVILSDLV